MSIITSIQKRTGLLLVVILGALAAFILTEFISSSMRAGGSEQIVGEIDGVEIKYQEFNQAVQNAKDQMEAGMRTPLNESQMPLIRLQTWDKLVTEYALKPEWEKLGITVTADEIVDMVQGDNIHPQIKQSFTDPQTGQFDKDKVIAFLRNLPNQPAQVQQQWRAFEDQLPELRRGEKYENLLRKSVYVTSAEAKRRYEDENLKLDLRYVYFPYANIPDSAVTVTEDDLKEYYSEHQEDYEDKATVNLEYIALPIEPSATDSAEAKRYLADIKEKFAQTDNDTNFVALHSEASNGFQDYLVSNLPEALQEANPQIGEVVGPVLGKQTYRLYKITQELEDTSYSVKASHILISTQGKTDEQKAEAKNTAQDVLNKARAGEDFAALAAQYSDDRSNKNNGGDLGWFGEGKMVEAFEDAAFGASSTGVIPRVVETNFGYHIINVTEPKTNKKYRVASIARLLEASSSTREAIYRKAGDLAASKDVNEYDERVKEYNLISMQANDVKQNARSINNIYDPSVRSAIRWAFENDTKVGSISNEVFEVNNQYLVMYLKSRTAKGVQPLSAVRDQVKRKVLEQKKADLILSKLEGKSSSLEEIAAIYPEVSRTLEQANYTYITKALNGVGFAPKAVGKAFGMKEGEISNPIIDETGVVVMKVEKRTEPAEIADYAQYKSTIKEDFQAIFNANGIIRAIKELTDTEENIDSFY